MAQDLMTQFYTCLNFQLPERLTELTRIIDHSGPTKDLQALFPQLINNIFSPTFNNGWGLRTITVDHNRLEFEMLTSFLEPHGPMFRLCYKLLSEPQLKYNLPLNVLPPELQMQLERGRCPQFYIDMLSMDSQAMNVVGLALNPFDYYIFNFALYLINNNSQNKSVWENWNSVYFALACDYLMHFLPADPNVAVLPHIPNYTGKVPTSAPLQAPNRPLYSSSLLLLPDLSGLNNQHAPAQSQSRNEFWRSETILQVFIDIWMSVDDFESQLIDVRQRSYVNTSSSPERVRTVRVLVKHIHSYSARHLSEAATRAAALRKYARQVMCARGYQYVKYLVNTWPLDASFRLVLELWLSLIQPWRYTNVSINQDLYRGANQEDANSGALDPSYSQFIAENFPTYTYIFQLVLPRFTRLDLTAYKNAIMLFRLGKVFSQPYLVPILRDLEQGIMDQGSSLYYNYDSSWSNSDPNLSYTNGMHTNKWVALAKQSISELNLSTNFQYEPLWSDARKQLTLELLSKMSAAKNAADNTVQETIRRLEQQNEGFWGSIKSFLMMNSTEDDVSLQECKKVPTYLSAAIHQLATIFGLSESSIITPDINFNDSILEQSCASTSGFSVSITKKLRNKPTDIQYMGDPDLMPIASYESTILIRILYQIASRLNELYQSQFSEWWSRVDFVGSVAREVLQRPCTIRTYVKDASYHQTLVRQNLPARLSLRRLGSFAAIFWFTIGYIIFRIFSYSGTFYLIFLIMCWMSFVLTKASMKYLNIVNS